MWRSAALEASARSPHPHTTSTASVHAANPARHLTSACVSVALSKASGSEPSSLNA